MHLSILKLVYVHNELLHVSATGSILGLCIIYCVLIWCIFHAVK